VSETSRNAAHVFWQRNALDAKRVVALQPSAGAVLKSWPVSHWARLADTLVERGTALLLVGGPDDGPLLTAIQTRMARRPAAIACGQPLGVSAALYERCALLVGLDGGSAHLAAAVGIPTVRLYGPVPVGVFGPWPRSANQRVLVAAGLACVPCGRLEAPPCGATALPACMLALELEDVLNAVCDQLGRD
jgi:ADP-heptose:LPS heptosyltransferase